MHIITDNFNRGRRSVEVLKLQLPHSATVDGVGPLRAECRNIKTLRAFADFLVWREGDTHRSVRNIAVFQSHHRGNNFCDTRFIIRPEQGFAVGGDNRVPEKLM